MRAKLLLILIPFIFLALCGCGEKETMPTAVEELAPSESDQTKEAGYPISEKPSDVESGYPSSTEQEDVESGYPSVAEPVQTDYTSGPEFDIDDPLTAGDTVVTGTGPTGVPINLVDASEVGLLLAETVIDADSTFTFELDAPLEQGHMIGIMLGDLTGTDLDENDFIYSDTYYARPLIGILFDMVLVE